MTTVTALAVALRDTRRAWQPRASLAVAAFAAAAFVPLVTGEARLADLAGGLYLAVAAIGLAFAVGVAGLPSLAQGAFVATGAVVGAQLLEAGVPTAAAAPAGAVAGALAGLTVGLLFTRLPRAGVAAATW
ncbi:MAG: ABC transporter permease subunit, partial [Actinomycetota bacterium]